MLTKAAIVLATVLSFALFTTIHIEESRLSAVRVHAATAALGATNAAAARDSTRRVKIALLGDSLSVVEKQIVQTKQQSDALDRALGRERAARYAADASVDSLTRVLEAPALDSSNVHEATFDLRQPPYTIHAVAEFAPPLDSARLTLHLNLDTAHVDARVSCAAPNADGIRTASIDAEAPAWLHLSLGAVEQSPDVCASPALVPTPHDPRVSLGRLVIGIGRLWPASGASTWGAFVGTGLSIKL